MDTKRYEIWYDVPIKVLSVIYVAMLWHFAVSMWDVTRKYGVLFLGLSLIISILIAGRKHNILPRCKGFLNHAVMAVLLVAAVVSTMYFFLNFEELVYMRVGANNTTDLVFSFIMMYLVFHLCIVRSGMMIPGVAVAFLLYGFLGHLFPVGSFLGHPYMDLERVLEVCASQVDGIFGLLNEIGASYVAMFTFFAALVEGYGGLDYVIRLAYQIVGKHKSNIPQIAVISSMAFGGMSGSAIANVVGTGSFTIPTMKKFGVPGKVAGGDRVDRQLRRPDHAAHPGLRGVRDGRLPEQVLSADHAPQRLSGAGVLRDGVSGHLLHLEEIHPRRHRNRR